MNFLSHYYFDRNKNNPYEILGMILPDLLKNVNKSWNIFPEKNPLVNSINAADIYLLNGWKRHLLVDKVFHNSEFFLYHQHQIKLQIKDIIKESKAKPFFIGHITLELILDNLLITQNKIIVDDLYKQLQKVNPTLLNNFLIQNGIKETEIFFKFFDMFIQEKYLHSYAQPENITYALKRVCMRIWNSPFTLQQEKSLTEVIITYIKHLEEEFIIIFDLIESQLLND